MLPGLESEIAHFTPHVATRGLNLFSGSDCSMPFSRLPMDTCCCDGAASTTLLLDWTPQGWYIYLEATNKACHPHASIDLDEMFVDICAYTTSALLSFIIGMKGREKVC